MGRKCCLWHFILARRIRVAHAFCLRTLIWPITCVRNFSWNASVHCQPVIGQIEWRILAFVKTHGKHENIEQWLTTPDSRVWILIESYTVSKSKLWKSSHKFDLSRANQRCPRICLRLWSDQHSPERQRSTINRVASLWFVSFNCAFWPLWIPTERTQTLTRCPYLFPQLGFLHYS